MSNSTDIQSLKAEQAEFANIWDIGCERKKRIKDEVSTLSESYQENKTPFADM